eukprot:g73620.t1
MDMQLSEVVFSINGCKPKHFTRQTVVKLNVQMRSNRRVIQIKGETRPEVTKKGKDSCVSDHADSANPECNDDNTIPAATLPLRTFEASVERS